MSKYKHWDLLDELPDGWRVENSAGSPLFGYVFISDGKSILYGGKRALLKIEPQKPVDQPQKSTKPITQTSCGAAKQPIDQNYRMTANILARKKFEERLLLDIRADLMVCKLEGWSKTEYLSELMSLIASLGGGRREQSNDPLA